MITNTNIKRCVFGFVLVLSVVLGLLVFKTVTVKPSDSSLQEFSAERAFNHVVEIALNPHPIGSGEHDNVREYIISTLRGMGLTPQFQTTEVQDYFRINNNEPVEIVNIFVDC